VGGWGYVLEARWLDEEWRGRSKDKEQGQLRITLIDLL
jgi:hypothetical protein